MSTASGQPPRRISSGAYVLPISHPRAGRLADLPAYLQSLIGEVQVIVVDGSSPEVFASHAALLPGSVTHIPVDAGQATSMGKVGGVVTGVRHATSGRVIIADDDVRYTVSNVRRMLALLDVCDVVRPQNYFKPTPWHALWDGSRSLLNRAIGGGDWPGTLGVRRQAFLEAGGYRGDVMFENLELVRTIQAAGGRELVARDLYIARRPPSTRHFWSQRIRQAYDELARPPRMAFFLALLPALALGIAAGGWMVPAAAALLAIAIAEAGRRRAGGAPYFPVCASALAPLWLLERGVTSWLALGSRVFLGGVL
ncbi:MAG TPA: glycosyltransferase family 2 protein, partial [Candidatus Dormibacteraeota bacterium]|nr:glycosyltransferase family 2 protein [Candidatus Dormibacteraeota bacterium]